MISAIRSHSTRPVAVLVRLVAFVVAAVSVFVVPSTFAAAAAGGLSTEAAFTATGAAAGLTVLTSLAARTLDPLRSR